MITILACVGAVTAAYTFAKFLFFLFRKPLRVIVTKDDLSEITYEDLINDKVKF
jgi:hypothetical protein